jgi:hypothetical protein
MDLRENSDNFPIFNREEVLPARYELYIYICFNL